MAKRIYFNSSMSQAVEQLAPTPATITPAPAFKGEAGDNSLVDVINEINKRMAEGKAIELTIISIGRDLQPNEYIQHDAGIMSQAVANIKEWYDRACIITSNAQLKNVCAELSQYALHLCLRAESTDDQGREFCSVYCKLHPEIATICVNK